jgi:hypothetical protein
VKYVPINVELIKNPYNWLVVGLMVAILGLALFLIFGGAGSLPTTDGTSQS